MQPSASFPVVGLGASAGGISALEEFFRVIPADIGSAFVVITHLSPTRESHLAEVLANYTSLSVVVATEGTKVEINTVYVMPPAVTITMQDGALHLTPENLEHRERKPVDVFFTSLADDCGPTAIGIVMSGGDGDGALGVTRINERGGLTFAQTTDGSGPQNSQMPDSAIATGAIDFALPAGAIGRKLQELIRNGLQSKETIPDNGNKKTLADMQTIAGMIKDRTGHDMTGYKSKTFIRRLLRRMTVNQCLTIDAYHALLADNPEEIDALFRDLLISVTDFFRDSEAFEAVEKLAISEICTQAGPRGTIRIWVPGCSTGEEAYSLAILIRERLEQLRIAPRVQIFATDISDSALTVARGARYPEALLASVSPERRLKYFQRDGASYVVTKQIREMCVFSSHSLIADPPFSRMDLISCRNLLIYFGADLQRVVIPTFHYALRPGGYLLLGLSENVTQHADLFEPVSKAHRLFKRRETRVSRSRLPLPLSPMRQGTIAPLPADGTAVALPKPVRSIAEAQILDRYAPPHVVVDAKGDVLHFSARTGPFLEHSRGAPSTQLLGMVRSELRADVRLALREVLSTNRRTRRRAVLTEDGKLRNVLIDAEPIESEGDNPPNVLFVFGGEPEPVTSVDAPAPESGRVFLDQLERTIQELSEKLQLTVEEYETAAEELNSSNEEMLSVNEELQSTNEELEASKEEMQSLNEELNTINTDLTIKVEEIDRANADLKNLYESTQIASVFLDADLVIRQFTPAANKFFALRSSDVGRPLTELSAVQSYPALQEHIAQVFATGEMIERQLGGEADSTRYLVRLIPYRGGVEKIEGVVVTFFDVTLLSQAQTQQEVLIRELNHRVKNMLAVVIGLTRHTLSDGRTDPQTLTSLLGRLQSMSRTYELLSAEQWTEVCVRELIAHEIAIFGTHRICADGDVIRLSPEVALPLSMVLHELATNAAKYGALSNEAGHVDIHWEASNSQFKLTWSEIDGPKVKPGEQSGFGLTLLKGQIEHQLGGTAELAFRPDGFRAQLAVPL